MTKLYTTLFLVLAALTVAGLVFWQYFYLATITLEPTPSDATISLNGQPIADRTLHLKQGNYRLSVSAPGYQSQEFQISAGWGSQITKPVILVALPKPTQLLAGPVRFMALSPDRQTLFFEQSGVLYRYNLPTAPPNPPSLSALPPVPITPTLSGLESIDWAPDFNLAILHKANHELGLYDFHKYDLLHQEYRVLDSRLQSVAWSADGRLIYGLSQEANQDQAIVSLNRAGGGLSRLFSLAGLNFPLASPTVTIGPGHSLILSTSQPNRPGDLFLFDSFQRTPPAALTESGQAVSPQLSPDQQHLAYLDNGELVISASDGTNKRNTGLRPRRHSLAFVDNSTLAVFLPNQLVWVDLATGNQNTQAIGAASDAIGELIPLNRQHFIYSYQGALYSLNLPS